jgi:hypothetical protein
LLFQPRQVLQILSIFADGRLNNGALRVIDHPHLDSEFPADEIRAKNSDAHLFSSK